ncbi:MAG: hypothetical protein LBM08_13595, partial [Dysgonamonadaceae bacterium]|nr:hypothetical protein [Dysgonamonadaceae bacterium]
RLVCLPIFDEIGMRLTKKHLGRVTIKTEKTRLYRQTLIIPANLTDMKFFIINSGNHIRKDRNKTLYETNMCLHQFIIIV